MPLIKYTPRIEPWEKYFKNQADLQLGKSSKNTHITVYNNASVTRGLSTTPSSNSLTVITPATDMKKNSANDTKEDQVSVNFVSPAEATTKQAESEMQEEIKDGDKTLIAISKETAKRAATGPVEAESASRVKKR